MSELDPAIVRLLPALGVVVLLLLSEGLALAAGWGWIHRLGLVLRRGSGDLGAPLGPGEALPAEPRGAIAVWLGEQELGYWSGMIRLGMRGAHYMRATYGVGVMCSGTMVISADRRTVFWKERLRLSPLLLIIGVSVLAGVMFAQVGQPVPESPLYAVGPLLPLFPLLFFGTFYAGLLVASLLALRRVRRRLMAS